MIPPFTEDYVLSFMEGVVVEMPSQDSIVVRAPVTYETLALHHLSPGLGKAIGILASAGATEGALADLVLEEDGGDALPELFHFLNLFARRALIRYAIVLEGRLLAVLSPSSASFAFSPALIDPGAEYSLSRFSYIRPDRGELLLESPLSRGTVTLCSDEAVLVASSLAGARSLSSLCERLPGLPPLTLTLFLRMLTGAGFASRAPGETTHEETGALDQWEFHDLLFHTRCRLGRHTNAYGATYRFHGTSAPLPAVKTSLGGAVISLFQPDIGTLKEDDFPFTLVMEERRSIREYGEEPVTARQIGEFLYRAGRVKAIRKKEYQDLSTRVYPGGGAIYELELYLTVHRCADIPSGLYHYCPERHVLETISGPTDATDALLQDAKSSTGQEERPQVLITVTARFQRISWKYESMAYSLILKDVGVLYQTMYLVATAMDLAPCALGGGDSDLFAKAAGLDYYAETSVGEFALGSRRGRNR